MKSTKVTILKEERVGDNFWNGQKHTVHTCSLIQHYRNSIDIY